MYGMEEFLENVDFKEFVDAKELFSNGYLPFAIENIPEVKTGFNEFEKK